MHLWIVFGKVNPVIADHNPNENCPKHKARDENTLADYKLLSLLLQVAVEVFLDYIDEHDEHDDTHDARDGEEAKSQYIVEH